MKKRALPINQSIEGSKQLLHKTPDFRRYGGSQAFHNNYMDSATQQELNSNDVIVYSDQDDEQSVLNMLQDHSFKKGSLSLIT